MIALRTVRSVWQAERRNRNADEIADRAGKLYDKFVGFVGDLGAIGDSLGRTRQSWEAAMGKLTAGKAMWSASSSRSARWESAHRQDAARGPADRRRRGTRAPRRAGTRFLNPERRRGC